MHESVEMFVAGVVHDNDLAPLPCLEIGSFDVNGSCRRLFYGDYIGIDHVAGPGVDVVMDGEKLDFGDGTFDVVLTTEALEHALRPWIVWQEIGRVLKQGGWVIATLRGFSENGSFPWHNEPDSHRVSAPALRVQIEDAGLIDIQITPDPQVIGHFVIARKPEAAA